MTTTLEQLCELLDAGGLRIRFGLRQQEKFKTVHQMRGLFIGWESIAKAIGWSDGTSVMEAYEQESDPMYEALLKLSDEARSMRDGFQAILDTVNDDSVKWQDRESLVRQVCLAATNSQQKETLVAKDST